MTKVGARVHAWPVIEVHRWEIVEGTKMVGVLRLLRVQQPDLGEEYYQIQRPDGQICGEIDTRGRGWRYEPFNDEMVFIGMGSMEENCGKLLEVDGKVALVKWSKKAATEAAMRTKARKDAAVTIPIEAPGATKPVTEPGSKQPTKSEPPAKSEAKPKQEPGSDPGSDPGKGTSSTGSSGGDE